jgi:hypothetical protein
VEHTFRLVLDGRSMIHIVNIDQADTASAGGTGVVFYHDLVYKFSELPGTDFNSPTVNYLLSRRKNKKIDIEQEHLATEIARALYVPTPETQIVPALLRCGCNEFRTNALCYKFVHGTVFGTNQDLFKKLPVAFRADYMYTLLVDFFLGNWDRTSLNLVYAQDDDILVPIDYAESFSFDLVPPDEFGAERVFRDILVDQVHTNFNRANVLWLGNLFKKMMIAASAATDIIAKKNELVQRGGKLQRAMIDFMLKFKIGLSNMGIDTHYDYIRNIQQGKLISNVDGRNAGRVYLLPIGNAGKMRATI